MQPSKVEVFMRKAAFRLRARDWVGSAAGFAAVLGTLVVLDPRVGHRLSQFVVGSRGGNSAARPNRRTRWDRSARRAEGSSIDHAPLLVFTAVAVLLVGSW
jgi:hypothetical protein